MTEPKRIDWNVTAQAFALLGYRFEPPHGFDHMTTEAQLALWDAFLDEYMRCELMCPWKGGGPCISSECPRIVLRRVSLNALPLTKRTPGG